MRMLTLALALLLCSRAWAEPCGPQAYTAKTEPRYDCPSPGEEALVPKVQPRESEELKEKAPAPWAGVLMDRDRVLSLGLRIQAIRRLRWMDGQLAADRLAAEQRLLQQQSKAELELRTSQRESYKEQLRTTTEELVSARRWYRSWTFGVIVGVVVTSAAAIALAYATR